MSAKNAPHPPRCSWHNAANVMYVDQPVGTGLSFTTKDNYADNDEQVRPASTSASTFASRVPSIKVGGAHVESSLQQQCLPFRCLAPTPPFPPTRAACVLFRRSPWHSGAHKPCARLCQKPCALSIGKLGPRGQLGGKELPSWQTSFPRRPLASWILITRF